MSRLTVSSTSSQWGSGPPRRSAVDPRAGLRNRGRPPVVRFAGGVALDPPHQAHGAGDLVAGQRATGVGLHVFEGDGHAVARCEQGADPLAPPVVGHADDEAVFDVGMGFEYAFDLVWIDLFAAGVDPARLPAEPGHRARVPRA